MASGTFRIEEEGGTTRIVLQGEFDVPAAEALAREVEGAFEGKPEDSTAVVVDLTEAAAFSLVARPALVKMHKAIEKAASRTAYLADRALLRGLALWVCHQAGDPNAKPVATRAELDKWLGDTASRVALARNRAGVTS